MKYVIVKPCADVPGCYVKTGKRYQVKETDEDGDFVFLDEDGDRFCTSNFTSDEFEVIDDGKQPEQPEQPITEFERELVTMVDDRDDDIPGRVFDLIQKHFLFYKKLHIERRK
jgi:hypothetical protein